MRKQGGMGQFRQWLRFLQTARGGPDRESPFNRAPGDESAYNAHRFRSQKGNPYLDSSTTFLWILICWGAMLRLTQYLSNRSLWLDESSLALNIVNRSFSQLLKPLDYGQGAPLGFLILERLAVHVFGTHEYALRLFPFLCGIISLLLFNRLAKLCVTPKRFQSLSASSQLQVL